MSDPYEEEIYVYPPGEYPLEQPYVEAIKKAFPGYKVGGIYCPGKPGCVTYSIHKGDEKKIVHVHQSDLSVEE
jgi:hypothetical protein